MKKLRVAIIGCGDIAGGYDERAPGESVWTHAKAYRTRNDLEIVTAWDPNPSRLAAFCSHWGVTSPAKSPDTLLKDFSPDVVSICSPNETHPDWLTKCLAHSSVRGILCEKPLALDHQTAESLGRAVSASGKTVAVNYLRRWDQNFANLIRDFKSGHLGRAISGRVLYTKGVFHNASHAINLLEALFGQADRAQVISETSVPGRDVLADFFLEFSGGVRVWFEGLNHENFNHFEIEILTNQARIRSPGGGAIEIQSRATSALQEGVSVLGPASVHPSTIGFAMKAVADNLIEAVTSGKALQMPFDQAVTTTKTCDMIRHEAERNRR